MNEKRWWILLNGANGEGQKGLERGVFVSDQKNDIKIMIDSSIQKRNGGKMSIMTKYDELITMGNCYVCSAEQFEWKKRKAKSFSSFVCSFSRSITMLLLVNMQTCCFFYFCFSWGKCACTCVPICSSRLLCYSFHFPMLYRKQFIFLSFLELEAIKHIS